MFSGLINFFSIAFLARKKNWLLLVLIWFMLTGTQAVDFFASNLECMSKRKSRELRMVLFLGLWTYDLSPSFRVFSYYLMFLVYLRFFIVLSKRNKEKHFYSIFLEAQAGYIAFQNTLFISEMSIPYYLTSHDRRLISKVHTFVLNIVNYYGLSPCNKELKPFTHGYLGTGPANNHKNEFVNGSSPNWAFRQNWNHSKYLD